jgi:hypothetical protein
MMMTNVSEAMIVSPRSRRVEDNAPYRRSFQGSLSQRAVVTRHHDNRMFPKS